MLPKDIEDFIKESTLNYGKVKLVLQKSKVRHAPTHPAVQSDLFGANRTNKGFRWPISSRRRFATLAQSL